MEFKSHEKVIIIGSGPAGLTAAIYSARANLNPLMIQGEEVGGQLMTTTDVENYPGFPEGVQGPELMELLKKQAERFGTRMVARNVTEVEISQKPYKVTVGKEYWTADALIISTGASAKYLGLEDEKTYLGRGVSACATCDGAFFRDVPVAIVGGGDTAMEEALFLTRFASKVYVIHRRDSFRASKIMADRVLAHPKIEVLWNSEVKSINGTGKAVDSVTIFNTQTKEDQKIELEGVFIAIGHKPNTDIFKGKLEMDTNGYLITKPDSTYTSVDGVFACGDVQDHIYRQAITAAGTGCMAAIDTERWLENQGL
ncbi:MAG: thioredoxin-disulfide reductase [Bdellovibrionaceae bacterium]|nr:thioredoxin-disulfide reductase [Pseudobdellovibrionaceae bacterium]